MTSRIAIVCATAGALALGGCVSTGPTSNQVGGTVIGAAAGSTIGALVAHNNPLAGALIGGVIGAAAGAMIGAALDEQEREQLALASQAAAASTPTGQRYAWSAEPPPARRKARKHKTAAAAPASSERASGWVVPTSEIYQADNGKRCRNLHQTAVKNGKTYEQDVTACQTASGWEIPRG